MTEVPKEVPTRVLCLVNDSDPPISGWRETYDSHRAYWNRCFDRCASFSQVKVDGYFIRSSPSMRDEWSVEGRVFTSRGHENFQTMIQKLMRAIKILLTDEHDWVVYTGLSSLYDFPLLAREPKRSGVYAGQLVEGTYVSGAGVLMSPDVARALFNNRAHHSSGWNDIAIQQILISADIAAEHREMFIFDYVRGLDQIATGKYLCYRFRDYHDPHRKKERQVMATVFEKLYGDPC
jgi:hypothetical protein